MWWQRPSRLDRIEENMEKMQQSIYELSEISKATNRRIDRFVDEMQEGFKELREGFKELREGYKEMQERTEQLQRAIEYLLSRDGS